MSARCPPSVTSPSFVDNTSLIATQPSLLTVLMHIYYYYSLKWRYEFNNTKSGVVTFGETKTIHHESIKKREWTMGDDTVDELYKYQSPGVLKSYTGSLFSNVDDNIEKNRNKAGMIFSSQLYRRFGS